MRFNDQHRAIRDTIALVIDTEINPHAEQWAREGIFPASALFAKPAEHGGMGLDHDVQLGFAEELGRIECGASIARTAADTLYGQQQGHQPVARRHTAEEDRVAHAQDRAAQQEAMPMPDITSLVFEVISPTQEGDVPRIHIDIGLSEDFSDAKSIRLLYANSRDGNYSVTIERTDASQHFTTTIDLPTYATPGWYGLVNLELVTNAGQYLLYQGSQLAERGFNTAAQLDNPWGDSVSPVLDFIEVSPVQQAEDGTFRFRVKLQVSDDDSGLDPAFCQIAIGDPNGNAAAAIWGAALTPYSSGGFAEYEIGLSKYSQNGTYWIGAVTTFDLAGNHGTGQEYLSVHPITFDIVNPDADDTGPAIHDFKISVGYDPVTNRPLISATVQASDDKVGMWMVGVNLTAANGLYGHELNFDGGIDVGGMKEYTGTLALPIDAVQGEYRIYRVQAMDLMINVTTLLNSDLANAGYDTIVRIYFPEDTSSGSAVVNGSSQADYVFGSDLTNDTLSGVAGNDYLYGGDGADLVSGGSGDDLIVGGSGAGDDTYIGGLGTDTASPWYPPGGAPRSPERRWQPAARRCGHGLRFPFRFPDDVRGDCGRPAGTMSFEES